MKCKTCGRKIHRGKARWFSLDIMGPDCEEPAQFCSEECMWDFVKKRGLVARRKRR